MLNSFNKLVDYFLHPKLKADKSTHEKSRIYVLAFVIIFGMGFLYSAFYLVQQIVIGTKAFHNYLGLSLSIAGLLIIKKTGNTKLALFIGSIVGLYLVSSSVFISDGINSNDVLWYIVLAAASFMFIGIREGALMTLASFISITIFYIVETFNWIEFDGDSISMSLEYRYFNLLLILGVLSLMVYVLVSGNNKLQQLLQLAKEQKVREEIARDFHDQIGNKLASLRHLAALTTLNKSEIEKAEIISKIDRNAKEVYDNFKDFIWTKDPKSDQLQELFMYLRDFADDYLKYSNINLFVHSEPEVLPNIELPPNWSKQIVPLLKEAITNVYKHAKAKNIYFTFSTQAKTLEIRLKDDGKGIINTERFSTGKGIKNMKYRADQLGANISFNNILPTGTEIIFSVQLPVSGSTNG
ncbi:MAG: hypothetical protein J0M08_02875 [Bacteroidetes bacterium]|nr:hypothetical protein [Bacteroidota bacterium]